MIQPAQELLVLRLKTLRADVEKVGTAVVLANGRNEQIIDVVRLIGNVGEDGVLPPLRSLSSLVYGFRELLGDNDEIAQDIKNAQISVPGSDLLDQLMAAPEQLEVIRGRLREARDKLLRIHSSMVNLSDRSDRLNTSLSVGCDQLKASIAALEEDALALGAQNPRPLWDRFEVMLVEQAQPLFREYVDFLGGLTVRDMGLDDRVCEMTEVLLRNFTGVVIHFFPIPAAQAALSSAMDSVVKLGFPEWTVWGVPLVAHEVGLALCNDRNAQGLQQVLAKWSNETQVHTLDEVKELTGDAFAAYTMGPAYGCAALLLRLQPHHDEPPRDDQARDVDRARLILGVLRENTVDPDTDYSAAIRKLERIWRDAVTTMAGPTRQAEAERELVGPRPEQDWLDDFQRDVLDVLRANLAITPFSESQWPQVLQFKKSLLQGTASPLLESPGDLLEILNAGWAIRLDRSAEPDRLSVAVTALWEKRTRPRGSKSGIGR